MANRTTKISTAISPSYVTAENFLIQNLRLSKIMNGPQISVGDAIKLYSEGCQLLADKFPPLKEIEEGSYVPSCQKPDWFTFYSRLDCMKSTGLLNSIFTKMDLDVEQIWRQCEAKCKENDPLGKFWRDQTSGKEKDFKYPSGFFPTAYRESSHTPRLTLVPGNTVSTLYRPLKATVLKELASIFNGYFTEIDIVSCHLRFAASLGGRERVPLVFDALEQPDFWNHEVKTVMREYPIFRPGQEDILKGILKVRLLLSINGGNPNSARNLKSFYSKEYHKALGLSFEEVQKFIIQIGEKWEPLQQLRQCGNYLMSDVCYTLDSDSPYVLQQPYKSLSIMWNALERQALATIVEEILEWNTSSEGDSFLPVGLEHDGLLIFSKDPLSTVQVEKINRRLLLFSAKLRLSAPVGVTLKKVYSTEG